MITGRINHKTKEFELREDIEVLKKRALTIPEECNDCINIFHCSRGCPDYCIYEKRNGERGTLNAFRCRLNQLIAVRKIQKSANKKLLEYAG
jgi:radical SAM protein with 4Fe4S-binding SPASM domain